MLLRKRDCGPPAFVVTKRSKTFSEGRYGRGSFITGPSIHNQRIEWLWRDVFRCVSTIYYLFYALEESENSSIEDPTNIFALHFVFLPRINKALHEYHETFNHHDIRTANSWNISWWYSTIIWWPRWRPSDLVLYGHDPQGPFPFHNGDNNVTTSPIEIPKWDEVFQIS